MDGVTGPAPHGLPRAPRLRVPAQTQVVRSMNGRGAGAGAYQVSTLKVDTVPRKGFREKGNQTTNRTKTQESAHNHIITVVHRNALVRRYATPRASKPTPASRATALGDSLRSSPRTADPIALPTAANRTYVARGSAGSFTRGTHNA